MDPQEHLLTDIQDELNFEPVSAGIRFANYIVDLIVFYLLCVLVALALNVISPGIIEDKVVLYLVTYSVYILYYTFMEGANNGRTLGKLITGSRAIKDDGGNISWNDALLRSLSRIVPFEPFSAFGGNPWHDTWTHTKVVKNKKAFE